MTSSNSSPNRSAAGRSKIARALAGKGMSGRSGLWWFRLARALALASVLYVLALTALYRFVNPPVSNFMMGDLLAGNAVAHQWVPIERMSPKIVRAVISSEDTRFCEHWGVDWQEIGAAISRADSRGPRGASTISMQTAKNLFLWPGRSYVRKAIELPLTYWLEFIWPKERVLEIYLNIAEWGPGVYGIEAAAQHHFGIPARRLNARQAARLAAALPNPRGRLAGQPGRLTRRIAAKVQGRMRHSRAWTRCVLGPGTRLAEKSGRTGWKRQSNATISGARRRPAHAKRVSPRPRTRPRQPTTRRSAAFAADER